ncbi:hypothetical protein AB0D37_40145 [Streptomyces sp. NPDC048384]|uniref:hypothetical protein n=1 Tax=Streptomyces sp. NPDC048384 TaxID=3155487 RepID=UPI00343147D0
MGWVDFKDAEDVSVDLAGMSWRSTTELATQHRIVFDSPVPAAIAPDAPQDASPQYRARYDELGMLRVPSETIPAPEPFEDRREEIMERAQKVIRDGAHRSAQAAARPQPVPPASGHSQPLGDPPPGHGTPHHQGPRP